MRRVSIVLGLVFCAACGRETTAPAGQLTPGQAQQLATSMAGMAGSAAAVSLIASRSATTPFNLQYTTTFNCPGGGTLTPDINLSGGYDQQARSMYADVTGKETAASCASTVDGQKVTVSGTFDLTGHAAVSGGQPEGAQTFTVKGSFDWKAADGRRGTCSLDLAASADITGKSASITGSLCGHAVDFTGALK